MPTEEVPESMYQDERGVTDAWKNRKFEFGLVNLPNPGYTNAAHKNGVLSIGCIFLPRTGLKHTKLLTQDEDGNFPYAEKLVEMCEYYGIDGWFINQEEAIPSTDIPLYKAFMKQMRDAGLYIQWYDSVVDPSGSVSYQNEFNSANCSLCIRPGNGYPVFRFYLPELLVEQRLQQACNLCDLMQSLWAWIPWRLCLQASRPAVTVGASSMTCA